MKLFRGRTGFTLIELLVVILILAILMAIALPLYLRAVRDSERQTCRSNMQTIANAEQAYKVRSVGHVYTTNMTAIGADALLGTDKDLQALPRCPTAAAALATCYSAAIDSDGQLTITCLSGSDATYHNDVDGNLTTTTDQYGFKPGIDSK